jgi:hypothetical protein
MWPPRFNYKAIAIALVFFFVVVLVGAGIITALEDINFLNAFYLNVMTATTIGYGDFVPTTDGAKMFMSFYSLLSVGSFFYMLGVVAVANVQNENSSGEIKTPGIPTAPSRKQRTRA